MEDGRLDRRVGQHDRQHRRHPRDGSSRRPWRSRSPGPAPVAPSGPGSSRATVGRSSSANRWSAGRRPPPRVRPRWSPSPSGTSVGRPARTRSSGSRVPMTPVERSSVRSTAMPGDRANARATASWSASPAGPVAAFAQPLVETIAVGPAVAAVAGRLRWRRRWACDRRTGAAAKAFGVKTAAAAAGRRSCATTARSGRPDALIPAVAPPAAKPPGRRPVARRPAGRSGDGRRRRARRARSVVRSRPSRRQRQLLETERSRAGR